MRNRLIFTSLVLGEKRCKQCENAFKTRKNEIILFMRTRTRWTTFDKPNIIFSFVPLAPFLPLTMKSLGKKQPQQTILNEILDALKHWKWILKIFFK